MMSAVRHPRCGIGVLCAFPMIFGGVSGPILRFDLADKLVKEKRDPRVLQVRSSYDFPSNFASHTGLEIGPRQACKDVLH